MGPLKKLRIDLKREKSLKNNNSESRVEGTTSKTIHKLIEKIARRRSNKKNAHSFEDIEKTLTTYYNNQASTYEQVKEKAGVNVGSSTYSEWKRELDKELN